MSTFTLRAMQPSDSAAVASLITEFDGDLTTRFQVDAYTAITSGTKYHTLGVVVESAERGGLVGMGTVRFSNVQFNGEILPLAFLDGLKVHKDFRGQGLGYQIADWRIQQARELYGGRCVIGTGMESNNHASRGVAKKWCREFTDPAMDIHIQPVRTRPPKPPGGITVREIGAHEYEEFAARQNAFFQNHNLYDPETADSIRSTLDVAADGRKPYRYYAALDANGNLLAGAQTWARGVLKSDTFNDPPLPLRMLNSLFHLLPADFVIRDVSVSGLWHQPGQIRTAQFLWEMVRWLCRDQGTTIIMGLDPKDPTQEIVKLKPWHQPRPKITLAIHGPAPIDRSKLLFVNGRV
jgi:predicted N-acetyltransferase YhbS